jgi:hypothetical protein
VTKFSINLIRSIEETIQVRSGLVRDAVLVAARGGVDGLGVGELASKLGCNDVLRTVDAAVGDGQLVLSANRARGHLPRAAFAAIIDRRRKRGWPREFEADVAALLEGDG